MADSPEEPSSEDAPASAQANAANPVRFVPFVVLGILFVAIGLVFGTQFCNAQHQKKLLRTGAPGTAEIINVVDTGNRYNRNPEVELTLMITPDEDGEPYEAVISEVLDAVDLQTYVRGAKIYVRFDPADPRDIAIAGVVGVDDAPPAAAGSGPDAAVGSEPDRPATAREALDAALRPAAAQ